MDGFLLFWTEHNVSIASTLSVLDFLDSLLNLKERCCKPDICIYIFQLVVGIFDFDCIKRFVRYVHLYKSAINIISLVALRFLGISGTLNILYMIGQTFHI